MGVRHIATSIDGMLALSDYRLKKMAPYCMVNGKPLRTAGQVKKMLREAKEKGMEVIPPPECDNYDEKGRCKGHEHGGQVSASADKKGRKRKPAAGAGGD